MEKMFFGGRRTGKTIELIKRSAETKIPIMVANAHRADALMHQADRKNVVIFEKCYEKCYDFRGSENIESLVNTGFSLLYNNIFRIF